MARYLSFMHRGRESFGAVLGDRVANLGRQFPSLQAMIESGQRPRIRSADLYLADITFLPPIPRPGKILCVAGNGAAPAGTAPPPGLFLRPPGSLVGHASPLLRPQEAPALGCNGELALVIGRGGRRIPVEQALGHVFGVTIANGGGCGAVAARPDAPAIPFDRSGAIGPWLVTADAIDLSRPLALTTRVNGAPRQSASTAELNLSLAELISHWSIWTALEPGDVLLTGSPAGSELAAAGWLAPGDLVEIDVPGIGVLHNRVIDEPIGER